MTKTTQRPVSLLFKCQRCDEEEDRDRAYTRSGDLVAHFVNKHKLYPVSIRHNAPYLAVKSDLRPATAEETAKYKDANNHRRKKADERASTGEASASGTTVEPEAPAGTSHERERRESKGDPMASSDKGRKHYRGYAARDKHTERRKDLKHDNARIARETADEKDLADEEADQREYSALQNKMEARRFARKIKTTHDTLAALRPEQDILSPKTTIVVKSGLDANRDIESEGPGGE